MHRDKHMTGHSEGDVQRTHKHHVMPESFLSLSSFVYVTRLLTVGCSAAQCRCHTLMR